MLLYREYPLILWVVIACIGILFAGMEAYAQGQRGPCAEDIASICKDVQPGGGRLAKCLKDHQEELSQPCRNKILDVRKEVRNFQKACEDDVLQFCKDVKSGGGRIVRCLKEHQIELSTDCKDMMSRPQKSK